MENDGEEGDDQASGWLQVKKKHRSTSKFSLHGWVGGLSGKQTRVVHRNPPASIVKGQCNLDFGGSPLVAVDTSGVHHCVENNACNPNEDVPGMQCFDKRMDNQGIQCLDLAVFKTANVTVSDTEAKNELAQNDEHNILPKIKWRNLDDGALQLHSTNNSGIGIRFGDIGNDVLVSSKVESAEEISPSNPSGTETNKISLKPISVEANEIVQESRTSSSITKALEENCEDVKMIPSEDARPQMLNETSQSGDISSYLEIHGEQIKKINDDTICFDEKILCTDSGEARVNIKSTEPALTKSGASPSTNGSSSTVAVSQDSESETFETEKSVPASIEDSGDQQAASINDKVSIVQIASVSDVDDESESKERFRQRLWCFLFENLNRAVDELYLLCELECDVEQMKEAILVLEEAASDFRELNGRVDEFEKVKRSSLQLSEEAPVMKSEYHRPHALSWEVRRMTTSPQRAEILSSSLEAFKRIQQERAVICIANNTGKLGTDSTRYQTRNDSRLKKHSGGSHLITDAKNPEVKRRKHNGVSVLTQGSSGQEKRNVDPRKSSKINSVQNGFLLSHSHSSSDSNLYRVNTKESPVCGTAKHKPKQLDSSEKEASKKDKSSTENVTEKNLKSVDNLKRQNYSSDRDMDKRRDKSGIPYRSMDAWKQKRNWEDILTSPTPLSRKSAESTRILHEKLMSPEKKKKTAVDLKREAEEKHARATSIRTELENERVQKLQRTSEKLNRVNEWQAVRSSKLREGMHARHQRSESRHEAHLAQVARRAGNESSKVNEVRFITSLNEENKKLMLLQKHQDSELRRAEKLKDMKTKQKEDVAREEAVLERRKLIEAEKLQRLVETQRKKEEAQLRREEERKASSAAREAKAVEQMRRKEVRAKAQQEEAELLAQKLAERLSESEQRRKVYLEQIRERASMDFRDQVSPFSRRSTNKDSQGKLSPTNNVENDEINSASGGVGNARPPNNLELQHSLKRRIKKIRQKLMALKHELPELSFTAESASSIGQRAVVGTARAKAGRWLQELQRHRLARKEGAASIGLVTAEMIKFLEGKDHELHACRQAGVLDFIASALPASHTSKPEACQVTIYLLRLLKVVLWLPSNRSYFLSQNLLPPIIPMLAASLENYINIAASSNVPSSATSQTGKTSMENLDSISEVLDGFIWTVAAIIGHTSSDERQLQMQDGLLELLVAYQVIHRLRDLFALYDRPQVEGSPFPSSILLTINFLVILTSKFKTMSSIDWESFPIKEAQDSLSNEVPIVGGSLNSLNRNSELQIVSAVDSEATPLQDLPEDRTKKSDELKAPHSSEYGPNDSLSYEREDIAKVKKDETNGADGYMEQKILKKSGLKHSVAYLLSAISETGLVCLPSLLTAVLLQANNRLYSEQAPYILPSNFEEVATGVLKVLNNLALVDINFMQRMLARADLKMEFFHLMSFLLSHCSSKWGVAPDQTGLLLLESLLLLSYFALFHPENQAVLRWGKSPTILHKVCDLPFVFFSDPELMPILAGTLVAACFGCEQNKGVVQLELSTDMLLSLLRSCRTGSSSFLASNTDTLQTEESFLLSTESKKLYGDILQRSHRYNVKSTRIPSLRGSALANSTRNEKNRSQKDGKVLKLSEEIAVKHNPSVAEFSSNLMLHSRFPRSFIDRAEQFFSAELPV